MSKRNEQVLSVNNNLNLPCFCFNQQWKWFLFSSWHVKFHQYLHPEPHSTRTFTHQFDLLQKVFAGTQYQLFSAQYKRASGRWIKSPVSFEIPTVLHHLGVLPRVSFAQIRASNHVLDFFHCVPEPVASPRPRVPGDRVGAAATSSSGEDSLICFRQDQLG